MRDPFADPNNSEARPTQGVAVDVGFTLDWASAEARHRECLFLPWLEPERDRWPGSLGAGLRGLGAGAAHEASRETAAALVPHEETDRVLELPASAFNRGLRRHRRLEPRAGCFYPRAFLAGHAGIEAGDRELFRVEARKP